MTRDEALKKAADYARIHKEADAMDDAGGPDQGADLRNQATMIGEELHTAGFDVLDLLNDPSIDADDGDEDDIF